MYNNTTKTKEMNKQDLRELLKSLEGNDWFRPIRTGTKLSGGMSAKKAVRKGKKVSRKTKRSLRKLSGGKKRSYSQNFRKAAKPAMQYASGASALSAVGAMGAGPVGVSLGGAAGLAGVAAMRRAKKVRRQRLARRSKKRSLKKKNMSLYKEYAKYK